MTKEQIEETIEELRQLYLKHLRSGFTHTANEVLEGIEYWEKKLNDR